ncbi:MAG: hypothetical protein HY369_00785 [Candidatus Aenigmarchaeota archaeon]|nr:hypothetical protein [Candidatus Aenigmarchaeota archaeon]
MIHPEVADEIRDHARRYVDTMQKMGHPSIGAMAAGYISAEDLVFLGAVNGAGSAALDYLVGTDRALVRDHPEAGPVVMQDDPAFRDEEHERQYRFVADLFACTPAEAELRVDRINAAISRYVNDQVQKGQASAE